MNIAKINDIYTRDGREAALKSARAAMMDDWIIRKLEADEWEPGKKSEPRAARPAFKPTGLPAMRVTGKTAKSGGLAASQKRKREKAENDRQIRARMKSANGKGK
jgi:hypothetical protein